MRCRQKVICFFNLHFFPFRWAQLRSRVGWLHSNLIELTVVRPKYWWLLGLSCISLASTLAVAHWPGLRLPDQDQFQLFTSDHVFEKYDRVFKRRFAFEQAEARDLSFRMPLRFVWGVLPRDTGDHFDPGDRYGHLLNCNPFIAFYLFTKWSLPWMAKSPSERTW